MMDPALSPQPLLDLSTHPPRRIGTLPGLQHGRDSIVESPQLEDLVLRQLEPMFFSIF
jgi:hypothetical protein